MKQLFLSLFLCLFCNLGAEQPKITPRKEIQDREQRVGIAPHIKDTNAITHSFNTVLEPLHLTVIYAEITSPVVKIHKKMGEPFNEGEVLIELDDRIFEGNYAKALAAVTKFRSELKAKQELYADDALSRFELDEGVAALKAAEADYIIANGLFESTKIKAPYKGRVVKIAVKEFELGQLGKELITLVDDDVLYAKFLVTSDLFLCLKLGMKADIYIKETRDKITTTISRISPIIDPSSSTITVEAKIDNHEHKWWAGMSGRIDIIDCNKNPAADQPSKTHINTSTGI